MYVLKFNLIYVRSCVCMCVRILLTVHIVLLTTELVVIVIDNIDTITQLVSVVVFVFLLFGYLPFTVIIVFLHGFGFAL